MSTEPARLLCLRSAAPLSTNWLARVCVIQGLAQLLAAVAGSLLLIGLATPIAAVLGGVIALCSAVPFENRLVVATTGASLALLGPGAWSIDARLYGRRRIDLDSLKRSF